MQLCQKEKTERRSNFATQFLSKKMVQNIPNFFQILSKFFKNVVTKVIFGQIKALARKNTIGEITDGICLYGGERGIRTPVPVFAGNMISNYRYDSRNTIKSDKI